MAAHLKALVKKWEGVLNEGPAIKDSFRRTSTAVLLENTQKALREERVHVPSPLSLGELSETTLYADAPFTAMGGSSSTAGAGPVDTFDPILISMVRRAAPVLVAYDLVGVQPMTGPTGLIFALRSRYAANMATANLAHQNATDTPETFYNEVNTMFATVVSGANTLGLKHVGTIIANSSTTDISNAATNGIYNYAQAMSRAQMEKLGTTSNADFAQMTFTIEKSTVTAGGRALAAEYSLELAQDLKAVHRLDARGELINILSTEILAEINREVVRTVVLSASIGAQVDTTNAGIFDLDTDSDGRWMVEKFKGMMFQLDREANAIAKNTRRGKGNIAIMTSDVASALQAAGVLDYAPALSRNDGNIPDDTGNSFVGVLNGRIRVYIDPYATGGQYFCMGYRGASPFDAGIFYCPYVPLQLLNAVRPDSFNPRVGFKTRYGMIANPFAQGLTIGGGTIAVDSNLFYNKVLVRNLM